MEVGLEYDVRHAKGFYSIIAAASCVELAVDYSPLDPIKALFWSAVLNGIVSVPLMLAMMVIVSRRKIMGPLVASPLLRSMGWIAPASMVAAAATMLATNLAWR